MKSIKAVSTAKQTATHKVLTNAWLYRVPIKTEKPYTRDAAGNIVFPKGVSSNAHGRWSYTPR